MEFSDRKSCSHYMKKMRNRCRKRYEELSLKYAYDSSKLSEKEKLEQDKKIDEIIRLSIQNEFGCCYL